MDLPRNSLRNWTLAAAGAVATGVLLPAIAGLVQGDIQAHYHAAMGWAGRSLGLLLFSGLPSCIALAFAAACYPCYRLGYRRGYRRCEAALAPRLQFFRALGLRWGVMVSGGGVGGSAVPHCPACGMQFEPNGLAIRVQPGGPREETRFQCDNAGRGCSFEIGIVGNPHQVADRAKRTIENMIREGQAGDSRALPPPP